MIELYTDVLNDARLAARATPLIGLVTILYNTGYESELDEIQTYLATNDNLEVTAALVESNIVKCARSLLLKLGIDIDAGDIYQYPMDIYNLLITILEEIENYEDYESLLNIVDSGNPSELVIADLVTFIVGDSQNVLQEIIANVTDALMRVIRSSLTSRSLLDYDVNTPDHDAAIRAAGFITAYPNNYVTALFVDYGYMQTEEMLITAVDLDPTTIDNYLDVVSLTVAGILYVKNSTFEDAASKIESVLDLIIDESLANNKLKVSSDVLAHIKGLYQEVEHEEA